MHAPLRLAGVQAAHVQRLLPYVRNLQRRDPDFIRRIDKWYAGRAAQQSGVNLDPGENIPPAFTPLRLRDMVIGGYIADAVIILGSIDIVLGEVDR